MLQVRSGLVDMPRVESALHIVQSTSPSYLLMTSLDLARHELAARGAEMAANALSLAAAARERIAGSPGFSCPGGELIGRAGIAGIDSTRLIVCAAELGITGFELKQELYEASGVDFELADHMNALGIVTYANTADDMDRLAGAIEKVSRGGSRGEAIRNDVRLPSIPPMALTPREAYYSQSQAVPWEAAEGRVAAEMIAPYPPGIPAVYPGEAITREIWDYIEGYRAAGRHMHGPADGALSEIRVIEQQ
jgi:arginine/lysine/ornithine decarboxylase